MLEIVDLQCWATTFLYNNREGWLKHGKPFESELTHQSLCVNLSDGLGNFKSDSVNVHLKFGIRAAELLFGVLGPVDWSE